MKKVLLTLVAAFAAMTLFAQKTTVAVGEVQGGSNVGSERVTALRSLMISGLAEQARLSVLDVKNLGMNPSSVKLEELQKYNVQYLITAKINSMNGSSSYSDGKTYYKAEMEYVVTITDAATGQVTGSATQKHYGTSTKNYESAYADSFGLIGADMKELVAKNFPLTGKVVSIDQSHPKKGAMTVYVELGADAGLKAGTKFDILQVVEVVGQPIKKTIGSGKVKEISSGTLSLCQINKGGLEVQNAMNSGVTVLIVTKYDGDIFDKVGNIIK